jgi:hypothetical protein
MKPRRTRFSDFSDLDTEIQQNGGSVPLAWVSSTPKFPLANLGDALSPVVLSAMAGLSCVKKSFDSHNRRVLAVGTIGHEQKNGIVHVWGSGVDERRNCVNSAIPAYIRPPNTLFFVHAIRGPISRRTYESAGIPCPAVYGDPGCFLPKIIAPVAKKTHELGVIVHISELGVPSPSCNFPLETICYRDAEPSIVKMISTYHEPTWEAFNAKLTEIFSCKRILSSSFHGLIIPQSYNIPSLYLHSRDQGGFQLIDIVASSYDYLDHRVADFYLGQNTSFVPAYSQPRDRRMNWEQVIDAIDTYYEPLNASLENLFQSCPIIPAVSISDDRWELPDGLIGKFIW